MILLKKAGRQKVLAGTVLSKLKKLMVAIGAWSSQGLWLPGSMAAIPAKSVFPQRREKLPWVQKR